MDNQPQPAPGQPIEPPLPPNNDANQIPPKPEVAPVNVPPEAQPAPSNSPQSFQQTTPASQVNTNPQIPTQPEPIKPEVVGPITPPEKEKTSNGVLSFTVTIVVALLLTQLINMFFFQSYRVFGSSMYPTFHDGDRLIVSKVGKTTSKITNKVYGPSRGQVIVFTSPKDPDTQLIKRVIGLPGERVVVKNSKITVYNDEHPEGFNPDDAEYGKDIPPTSGEADVVVPKDHVFVSGDNRIGSNSFDSRDGLGTVPEELIVGKAVVRLWPLQDARFF